MFKFSYYLFLLALPFNLFSAAFSDADLATSYLAELEKDSYWRLFVDGFRQDYNFAPDEAKYGAFFWTAREPNGLIALRKTARQLLTDQLDTPLTLDLIVDVNRQSFPVNDHLYLTGAHLTRGEVRTFGEIHQKEHRLQVLKRAMHFAELRGTKGSWPYKVANNRIEHLDWTYEDKANVVNKLLENYHFDLAGAANKQDKLAIIAQLMQDIELLHIFTDGNCRTVYLLLNKELMRNEFEPAILFNPNYFDAFAVNELVTQITLGQAAFRRLVSHGLPYEDCLSADEIAENIAKMPEEIGQNIEREIGMTREEAASIFAHARAFLGMLNEQPTKHESFAKLWNHALHQAMCYSALLKAMKQKGRSISIEPKSYLASKELTGLGYELATQILDSTDETDISFCMFFERLNVAMVDDFSLAYYEESIHGAKEPVQVADEFLQRLGELCI